MTLKELIEFRVGFARYRPCDIARILNKSRQSVSLTLNRDVKYITVRTLCEYIEATGRRVDLTKLIRDQ